MVGLMWFSGVSCALIEEANRSLLLARKDYDWSDYSQSHSYNSPFGMIGNPVENLRYAPSVISTSLCLSWRYDHVHAQQRWQSHRLSSELIGESYEPLILKCFCFFRTGQEISLEMSFFSSSVSRRGVLYSRHRKCQ